MIGAKQNKLELKMSAILSIHNVKTIEIERSKSYRVEDQHYTDIIITCIDGSKITFDLFSKSKLKIKELKK